MQLTKYTHACVRLDDGDRSLVIDPGTYSEDEAFEGATDFLVTHEHADHLDVDRLVPAVKQGARIHTLPEVAETLEAFGDAVQPITSGETRTVAGFLVEAVGGLHAEIYDGLPGCSNIGFLIDAPSGVVYHPGDSVFVPEVPVGTLLVPVSAPWLKLVEAIEFVRAIRPHRAHPIHDAMLSEIGLANVDRWLEMKGNTAYSRIAIGESATV